MQAWRRWLLVALVVQFSVLSLREARSDGLTVDEAFDVTSGLAAVVHHDTRFVNEHGLLPRVASALPAVLADPEVPKDEGFRTGDWFQFSEDVVVANDAIGRWPDILWWARLPAILFAVLAGLGIHRLASSLFGADAGLVAAAAWFTTPFVIGMGHLATIDVPFAAAVIGSSLATVRYLRRPGDGSAVVLGLAVAATLLTRHLGVVLLATAAATVLLAGAGDWRVRARHAVLVSGVAMAAVWLLYRIVDPGGGESDLMADAVAAASDDPLARLVTALPMPPEWRAGFAHLTLTSDPRPAYLLGQAWVGSRWWFFPGSAVVKLPALLLVALVGGLVVLARRAEGRREALIACGVPAAALGVALLAQPLNLGLRYAIPILALLFVLASPVAGVLRGRAGRIALGGVLAAQLVSCWVASPHSLAWAPPPFTDGYRWASDSNIDYGQDLFRLREWEHVDGARVAVVAPRGLARPASSLPLVGVAPAEIEGWVAVGATALTVISRDELAWLRAYCPVGTIGGSILLYRFDEPPSAEPGPTMPAAPCDGSVSVRSG